MFTAYNMSMVRDNVACNKFCLLQYGNSTVYALPWMLVNRRRLPGFQPGTREGGPQ